MSEETESYGVTCPFCSKKGKQMSKESDIWLCEECNEFYESRLRADRRLIRRMGDGPITHLSCLFGAALRLPLEERGRALCRVIGEIADELRPINERSNFVDRVAARLTIMQEQLVRAHQVFESEKELDALSYRNRVTAWLEAYKKGNVPQ